MASSRTLLAAKRGPAPKKKKLKRKFFGLKQKKRNKNERNERVSISN